MGLHLHLRVNFKKIKAEDWESAWTDSLDALHRFPLPLCRLGAETINGRRRLIYARDLRINPGHNDEGWKMEGDLMSGKRGETFCLNRNLSWYTGKYAGAEGEVDLWGSKTQGFPYHLALLAVGILLENRFPDHCYVFGDIDQNQTDAVIVWLETVYGKSFLPPLCLDAERLFLAKKAGHKNNHDAMQAFGEMWRGSSTEKYRAFLKHAGRNVTFDLCAWLLNGYDSLVQWGARDLLRSVLEATGSVPDLIAFIEHAVAQRPADKKPFDWLDALKLLCDDYIFINPVKREAIKQLADPGEDMQNIDQVLGQLFIKMAGMPYVSPLYVPEDELLEFFALRDPERGVEYQTLIEKKKADLEELLSNVHKTAGVIDEMVSQNDELRQLDEEEENYSNLAAPHERYILRQAWQQKDRYTNVEKTMEDIRQGLSVLIQNNPTLSKNMAREEYLNGIYTYTSRAGIGLSEAAWSAIDALTDKIILKHLHALSAINNNELTFWRWRIHIFETPDLWEAFRREG